MKKLKFLKLGVATALVGAGLISNQAQASELPMPNNFSQSLHELVKEQYDAGFISKNYQINVIKAEPKKVVMDGQEYVFPPNLDTNMAEIARNMCKVTVSFDKDGNALNMSGKQEALDVTNMQNETQKEMMREFVTLHEIFHCELASIENPITVEGKTKEFNDKINYYLKDVQSITDQNEKISYFGTLSETYGDIGATGLLLKKYGADNPDLNFVMKSIQTQRHAGYFLVNSNNHFTHMGMENLLNEDVKKKLITIQSGNEYKDEILKLANQSVQQLITQRKDLADNMFSQEKMESSIKFHIFQEVLNQSNNLTLSPDAMQAFRFSDTGKGFVKDIANKFVQEDEIDYFKNINFKYEKESDYDKSMSIVNKLEKHVHKVYSNNKNQLVSSKETNEYKNSMTEFKETIFNQYENKINPFDIKDEKTKAMDKMMALRNKFLEPTNNQIKNKITPK
jgi:hypothetical protein